MILCAFDIETSGLQMGSAKILEVACILYDTDLRDSFESYSTWVYSSLYPPPFEEALKINGLTTEGLKKHGTAPNIAFKRCTDFFNRADAVIAHNGTNFDRPIFNFECGELNITCPEKVWVDTRIDIDYPVSMASKRLCHLAVDHGLIWDSKLAHRAMYDAQKTLEIASHYNLDEAFKKAQSPVIRVEALNLPRERNHEAKARRYFWDPAKRCWAKNIREMDFEKEKLDSTFPVVRGK